MSSDNNAKARTYGSYLNLTNEQDIALKEFWTLVLDRLNDRPITQNEEATKNKSSKWRLKGILGGAAEEPVDLKVSNKSGEELKSILSKMVRCDHPDVKAVKYLMDRSWKVKDAYRMFISSIDFFGSEVYSQVAKEGERSVNINQLNSNDSVYYQYCKDGRLILYIWACRNFPSKYTNDENMKAIINLLNNHYLLLGDHSNITIVYNMNSFSMANSDMGYLRMMTKMVADHYPELLHRVLIHDAPWIFNSVWSVICNFLDPNIKSKVIFTKKDQLKEYVSEKKLITEVGGLDELKFEYFPPGDNEAFVTAKDDNYSQLVKQREDIFKKFEDLTYTWVKSNSKEEKLKRDELINDLAAINAKLNEYEYSPSIYHRKKVIENYDSINWEALSN
ncbi:CRAL/TRIO domain-containing protein [Conidiobolus coronatus NRRL 28638]|uniref:CRAL/TRIO domain-containing protein n=1 Tax=Conidiobolus coronatus (strain ATCC 28846 / CBS 209.66 / NRRL 28638) TaxID=796925 RepID=A0A137PJ07_CONC2|nr:CRAL/TRIO domain-containing protein [Conidiobolus coronatus NRRL 28638]|eukprot:KXN74965.1 CRAL/TRIO domain-containing protein [Conidiobolus coronatus NRRL 28638]